MAARVFIVSPSQAQPERNDVRLSHAILPAHSFRAFALTFMDRAYMGTRTKTGLESALGVNVFGLCVNGPLGVCRH